MISATLVTTLFLAFLAASVATRFWLTQRQIHAVVAHRGEVPAPFRDRISLEAHRKAADYTVAHARLNRWRIGFDALLLLLWTLGGGLQAVHDLVQRFGMGELASGVATLVLVILVSSLLEQPFNLYRTFVIEARFGFNRSTLGTWLIDRIKGLALGLLIGVPLAALLLWLMQTAGRYWWLIAWVVLMAFSLVMSWAFPTLIAPLFNKFTPLQHTELKTAIQALLRRTGFKSKGIFVMDGSRRSSHGNAYFTGLGKSKRIVFFDTLIDSLTHNQIVAVLAHELGHFKRRHILKGLALGAVMNLLGFAVLAWLMHQPGFYHGLGVSTPTTALARISHRVTTATAQCGALTGVHSVGRLDVVSTTPARPSVASASHHTTLSGLATRPCEKSGLALLLFILVTPVFTFFLNPLMSWLSRRHEYEADEFAARHASADDLIAALVTMYQDNASTLTPDPVYTGFYASHPPALARIRHLQQLRATPA